MREKIAELRATQEGMHYERYLEDSPMNIACEAGRGIGA